MIRIKSVVLAVCLACSMAAYAGQASHVSALQKQWANATYVLEGDAQEKAFVTLLQQADKAVLEMPGLADVLVWRGIIKSSFAGIKGGLSALSLIKEAKADLEQSMLIDELALSGSAYTSLGTLYFKAPGWPLSFGDDEKAKNLLEKALAINPHGIDSNYFYAQFLDDNNQPLLAKRFYLQAQQASKRPGRLMADKGRQAEIMVALKKLN